MRNCIYGKANEVMNSKCRCCNNNPYRSCYICGEYIRKEQDFSARDFTKWTYHHFVYALMKVVIPNYRNVGQYFNLLRFNASRAWIKYCLHYVSHTRFGTAYDYGFKKTPHKCRFHQARAVKQIFCNGRETTSGFSRNLKSSLWQCQKNEHLLTRKL